MDIINVKDLTTRSQLSTKHNTASKYIAAIKSTLIEYEQLFNISLEEAAKLNVVSEANIDAALVCLRTAHKSLRKQLDNK